MKKFEIKTIVDGRLDTRNLSQIMGGEDVPCTFTASCGSNTFDTCYNILQECTLSYTSCTGTEAGRKTTCGTSNTYERVVACICNSMS
jgi:hypothetical protein